MSMTAQLEKARDLLASHDAILFALLFGSMATGYTHPWSDVDIGVYVTTPLSLLEAGKLTAALERLVERDVDLLVLNDALERNPALAYSVIAEGILLFCKDENAFVSFKTSAILRYLDTAFLRAMVTQAFYERLEAGQFGKENECNAGAVAAT
jgi:predicted nucleotidyltransferase